MDRQNSGNEYKLKIDTEFQNTIKTAFPEEYQAREKELREQGKLIADQTTIKFRVGNTCEQVMVNGVATDRFKWTAFVKLENEEIDDHIKKLVKKVFRLIIQKSSSQYKNHGKLLVFIMNLLLLCKMKITTFSHFL